MKNTYFPPELYSKNSVVHTAKFTQLKVGVACGMDNLEI